MYSAFRLATILCATSGLMAQAMSDLNSLVLQASRYADHLSAGQTQPPELTLFRIIGNSGGEEDAVMRSGVDIQKWTLVYQVDWAAGPAPRAGALLAQSVSIPCVSGAFQAMQWSSLPVFDAKSIQWVWLALSLDEAIAQLNRLGYTRGFGSLTIMRPLHPRYPDECTFVFKCPLDHLFVGISAQTGKKLWTEPFPY
jgi:hypothetical protein